jgi:hypothetical protein
MDGGFQAAGGVRAVGENLQIRTLYLFFFLNYTVNSETF